VDHKAVAAAATISNHKLKHGIQSTTLKIPAHAAFLANPAKPLAVPVSSHLPAEDSYDSSETLRDINHADLLVQSSAAILRKSAADLPVHDAKPHKLNSLPPASSRPMMIRSIRNGFNKPISSKMRARTQQLLASAQRNTGGPVKLNEATGYEPQSFDAPTSLHPASIFMKAADPSRPAGLNAAAGYHGFKQHNRFYDERGNRLPDDLAPPSDNVNMRPPSDLPQWQTGFNQPPLFESDGGGGSIDSLGNNDNEQYPIQRSDLPQDPDSYDSSSPIPFHT
jgi:hypothetical protein